METNDPRQLQAAARRAVTAFLALLVCVAATVALTRLPFLAHGLKVAIALTIAVTQAGLLTAYLMQLISERRMIFTVLALAAVMFAALMALIAIAYADHTSKLFS
ncbi:MAG: hypothetical protein D6766_00900 [Verrucomicrobia bacterium]|nr:MAG: hypothetical protein D6766_00900 [Verrucomicrobiota bacterium]